MGFDVLNNISGSSVGYTLGVSHGSLTKTIARLDSAEKTQLIQEDTNEVIDSKYLKGKVQNRESNYENISSAQDLLSIAKNSLKSVDDLLTNIGNRLFDTKNSSANDTTVNDDIASLANEIDSKLKGAKFNNTPVLYSTNGHHIALKDRDDVNTLTLDFASTIASAENGGYDKNFSASLNTFVNMPAASELRVTSGDTEYFSQLTSSLTSLRDSVGTALGRIGSYTEQLSLLDNSVISSVSNEKVSSGKIQDFNEAMDQLDLMRNSITEHTSVSMLAQVNTAPQQIYRLFGG